MTSSALVPTAPPDFRAVLGAGSKSFSFAAKFLPARDRLDAAIVYTFCRAADDAADDAPDVDAGHLAVEAMREELRGLREAGPIVGAFLEVAARRGIDVRHAEELLEGVRSDLGTVRIPDDAALVRYGYRVAGTVGLLMCPIIGVSESAAYPFAVDLGVGMQITNICRDVAEDARQGRIYLPRSRLVAAGVDPERLLSDASEADRAGVATVVRDVVRLAEKYYESGNLGLRYIPSRPRVAIAVASHVYRAIGRKLVVNGANPFAGRTVVATHEKVVWALLALFRLSGIPVEPHAARLHYPLIGLPGANPDAEQVQAQELRLEGA